MAGSAGIHTFRASCKTRISCLSILYEAALNHPQPRRLGLYNKANLRWLNSAHLYKEAGFKIEIINIFSKQVIQIEFINTLKYKRIINNTCKSAKNSLKHIIHAFNL